jgi:hypothetical protein
MTKITVPSRSLFNESCLYSSEDLSPEEVRFPLIITVTELENGNNNMTVITI